MGTRADKRLTFGLVLVVAGLPLALFPLSRFPFVDVKLLVLAVGTLLIWSAKPAVDRRLTILAAAWLVAICVAAIGGVDPVWSLVGAENHATGLIMLGLCGLLIIAGAGLPETAVARLPGIFVFAGCLVSMVAVVANLLPSYLQRIPPGLLLTGSTVGQRYITGAIAAAAICVVLSTPWRRVTSPAALAILSSGLTVVAARAGWIAVIVFGGFVIVRTRIALRPFAVAALVVVAALAVWTGIDRFVEGDDPISPTSRFAQVGEGSARLRVFVVTAGVRAWQQRPLLGWGPGNTSGAWMSSATVAEAREVRTRVGDAHNLFLESLISTGALGFFTLAALIGVSGIRALRSPPSKVWATGAAGAFFVVNFFQPYAVAMTPLMFLFLGVAAGKPRQDSAPPRWVTGLVAAAIAAAILISGVSFVASVFEQVGRTYFSPWSLEVANTLAPWRTSAAQALALNYALDGRSGDEAASAKARSIIEEQIRRHPWHTELRLVAGDVETLLFDDKARIVWVKRHLQVFPSDPVARRRVESREGA